VAKLLRYDKPTKVGLRKAPKGRSWTDEEKFEIIRYGKYYGDVEVLGTERKYEWAVETFYEWVKRLS